MKNLSIHQLPEDLWGRAYDLAHVAPVLSGRTEQSQARAGVVAALSDGTVTGLVDALEQFGRAYGRDIHGQLISLSRNHLSREAGQIRQDIEHWLDGSQSMAA